MTRPSWSAGTDSFRSPIPNRSTWGGFFMLFLHAYMHTHRSGHLNIIHLRRFLYTCLCKIVPIVPRLPMLYYM